MPKLKDFIINRIQEIEDSLPSLREQVLQLTAKIHSAERELAELRSAAKAIGIPNGLRNAPLGVTRRTNPPVTIKEAALAVLAESPDGLLALDLLAKINDRFQMNLVRPSLSPQLTRLKREGKIINTGGVWRTAHLGLFINTDK